MELEFQMYEKGVGVKNEVVGGAIKHNTSIPTKT